MKKTIAIIAALLMFSLIFTGCAGSAEPDTVEINKVQLQMKIGDTFQLNVRVNGENKTQDVTYVNDNAEVAAVSNGGMVTACQEGSTVVMVKSEKGSGVCQIVVRGVKEIPLTAIQINGLTAGNTMRVGETASLSAAMQPYNANNYFSIVWTSDNPAVLTVDAEGKITAVASGEAYVTVSANGTFISAFEIVSVTTGA